MAREKPNMNVVFVGHVDAGKSTVVGRLMYDSGAVSEQEIRSLKKKLKSMVKLVLNLHMLWIELKKKEKEELQLI